MESLKLYYLPTCPYSIKVLRFLEGKDLPVKLCSTVEAENREYLIANGGKNQVPCLCIDEKMLYESDDIISWLSDRFL